MNIQTKPDLLRALIAPRGVALVGVSGDESKLTARPLVFMRQHGFAGDIYPINPGRSEILGLPAYKTVRDVSGTVEHAYIMLGTEAVIPAVEDCAAAGIKVVSVLADGFAEAGEEGKARQERLAAFARDAGILLVGPNSTGIVGTGAGFSCTTNAAFRVDTLLKGRLAVLSQSGSMIGTILSRGQARGAGFSALVSVGNEAAAGVGEIGQLLLDDPGTDGFLLFLETIRNADALAAFAAGAAEAGKPVMAYMIGRSDEGQALSVTHTGAMTGGAEAVAAFLREIGIYQVDQFETLIDGPRALTRVRPLGNRPRTVTVVSTTGGGGAMVVDQISDRGVRIAGCSAAAHATLEAQDIPLGHGKLVDVTLAGTKYETMKEVVSTLIADPETGLLVVAIGSSAQFNPELAVKPIIDAVAEAAPDAAPVMAFPLPHARESLKILEEGGVPGFQNVETCAETVAAFLSPLLPSPSGEAKLPSEVEALLAEAPAGVLDEVAAGAVFEALGADRPAQLLLEPDAAVPEDLLFAYPVVAKLVSPDLPHKTEVGAIRIGVESREALEEAIAGMRASAENHVPGYSLRCVLVQEMRKGLGEILIGITRDPLVGPVVTVGMGGVITEIYKDTAVRMAPVSREGAQAMLKEVKGSALLRGFRGRPKGDLDALATLISDVSRLGLYARVEEAEINPVLVGAEGEGVVLLDALVRLN
jgi:acetate---CoA ligase (ADP-forming)